LRRIEGNYPQLLEALGIALRIQNKGGKPLTGYMADCREKKDLKIT